MGDADETWTDGSTIHVPSGDDTAKLALVVQGALLAAGSLEPRALLRLVGQRAATARYLALEAHRGCAALGSAAPRLLRLAVAELGEIPATTGSGESLELALADATLPEAPASFGILRPARVVRQGGLARAIGLRRGDEAQQEEQDAGVAPEPLEPVRPAPKSIFGDTSWADNRLARLLQKHLLKAGLGTGEEGEGEGAGELPVSGRAVAGPAGDAAWLVKRPPAPVPTARDAAEPGGTRYPEWQHERQAYVPGHCRVVEFDPPAAAGEPLRLVPDPLLHRNLARLGLGLARHDRRPDGDGLDLRALVDFAVDRATGHSPDGRVYETRLRTARDLGVLVLLDASGSTRAQSHAASVWDEQRRLSAALVSGLEAVGDRVAAYGFRSYGREDVRYLRIKDFDGRFDGAALRRLDALQPAGYTRLGAAIRHAVALTTAQAGTSRQLLVLVSDGRPYERDYDGRHATEDTRRALAGAVAAGVGCVCLSVGSSTSHDAIAELWSDVSHLQMNGHRDLGPQVEPLFRTALHAALEGSHGSVAGPAATAMATGR